MTRNLEIVPNDRKSTKYPSNMHKIGPEVPSVLHYVQLGSFNIYLFPSPFRGMGQNIRLSLFPPLSAGPICPELSGKILPISRYIGYVWFMKFQMSKQVPLSPQYLVYLTSSDLIRIRIRLVRAKQMMENFEKSYHTGG